MVLDPHERMAAEQRVAKRLGLIILVAALSVFALSIVGSIAFVIGAVGR